MTYQGYLIDLDGTIYRGNELIPAGKRFIETLQAKNIPFLFVTNNTTRRPKTVVESLRDAFDIHVEEEQVYTASLATVDYMKQKNLGKKVYVVGEEGLVNPIEEAGYIWDEENPDYVVVGLDKEISYHKMTLATLAIQNGAHFIGTNPDKNIPTEQGLLPGAGSMVRFFKMTTGVDPVYIGKPYHYILAGALARLGLKKEEVIMVGDNYETDIQTGIQNEMDTLLVLTGFTQKEEVAFLPIAPTYVLDSLDEWSNKL
ncbi:TIGR01457 family HAD-type hydrolase [Vagococcus lutrae]|uniref:Acid sugar phosphatase n=1 Tax=Vagococcus lutrae TaxID=81947 RepID=A0AAE9XHM3_9ENTE|nr:TIGR01457 family HAD-type hydrolase [Vagococcus lutrae]WCG22511.1 TIGR01457 family HAD-type hydrolase [Vagococcus lutrae]